MSQALWQPTLIPDNTEELNAKCGELDVRIRADDRNAWLAEIAELPPHLATGDAPSWRWVIYPWRDIAVCLPDPTHLFGVTTSRNYPIISRHEQTALHESRVLIAGLSVGRSVAQQLVRLGVRRFTLIDADTVAGSNLNRLVGSGLHDIGLSKARSLARDCLSTAQTARSRSSKTGSLDAPMLDATLKTANYTAIFEVIDSVGIKAEIREVAHQYGVPVLMPTDMDWEPFVDIDRPDRPPFGGRLSADDLATLRVGTSDFAEKTRLAMRVMGLDEWAPRSLLSGQMAQAGTLTYWSQIAPSAVTTGALAAAHSSISFEARMTFRRARASRCARHSGPRIISIWTIHWSRSSRRRHLPAVPKPEAHDAPLARCLSRRRCVSCHRGERIRRGYHGVSDSDPGEPSGCHDHSTGSNGLVQRRCDWQDRPRPPGPHDLGVPARPLRWRSGRHGLQTQIGALWLSHGNDAITRLTTAGVQTDYPTPTPNSSPLGVVAGPDGGIWFTEYRAGKIAHIDPTTHTVSEYPTPTSDSHPRDIVVGPDGALWFTESTAARVGRITTSGASTDFPAGGQPFSLAAAPDGIWVTFSDSNSVRRLNTDGTLGATDEIFNPNAFLSPKIALGPDGNLWVSEFFGGAIATINRTTGLAVETQPPTAGARPYGITSTSDGIWFTEENANQVAFKPLAPAPPPPPTGKQYIAMGDSYSSGEGVRPFEQLPGGGDHPCDRSSNGAYGPLLDSDAHLGSMAFVACSGAVTHDFVAPQYNVQPAQDLSLAAAAGTDTGLVTLTVGGNDVGFVRVITDCTTVRAGTVSLLGPLFGSLGLIRYKDGSGCQAADGTRTEQRLEALGGYNSCPLVGSSPTCQRDPDGNPIHELSAIYADIHAKAPGARIVVGLYPPLFPNRSQLQDLLSGDCQIGYYNTTAHFRAELYLAPRTCVGSTRSPRASIRQSSKRSPRLGRTIHR